MADNDPSDTPRPDPPKLQRVGADLIIPLAGLAFGAYYLWSIAGLPSMAQFNGRFLVGLMVVLVVLLVFRMGWQLKRGEARFSFADLAETPQTAILRWGVLGLAVGFTLGIPYAGFTLSIFLFLSLSMFLLGVRPWTKMLTISVAAAAIGYLLFIVALGARLPRGPVENFLAGIF
jgi:hypothetical protein